MITLSLTVEEAKTLELYLSLDYGRLDLEPKDCENADRLYQKLRAEFKREGVETFHEEFTRKLAESRNAQTQV